MSEPADMCHLFQQVTGKSWLAAQPLETGCEQLPLESELNLYRLMLSQMKKADAETRAILSRNLTVLIVRDLGLRKLLSSTFDFDESSQHVTTLDQRFMAMANLIACPPVICCTLSQYFDIISPQICSLMTLDQGSDETVTRSVRKLCTIIVNAMIRRNRKLAVRSFIDPLLTSLQSPVENLSPQQTIEVICELTETDFDLKLLLKTFPALLYIHCELSCTKSALTSRTAHAMVQFLKQVDNSFYLLDDALFNHFDTYSDQFDIREAEHGVFRVSFRATKRRADVKLDPLLAAIPSIACEGLREEELVDFCLLLMERLSMRHLMSPDCALLLCSLTSIFLQKASSSFAKYPQKWIRFLRETLSRLNSSSSSATAAPQRHDDQDFTDVRIDSIALALQIMRTLILEHEKVSLLCSHHHFSQVLLVS